MGVLYITSYYKNCFCREPVSDVNVGNFLPIIASKYEYVTIKRLMQ